MKEKNNYLLEKFVEALKKDKPGRLLDIGCGDGDYAKRMHDLGFDVLAADMNKDKFKYNGLIPYQVCNVTESLPFENNSFDYIILAEVIEHIRNPFSVIKELVRILRPGGILMISTPNILSLKSRFRYLIEGSWEYFREPPLEHAKKALWELHVIPWRYHELEYLLSENGLNVEGVYSSIKEGYGYSFFFPLIYLQLTSKAARSLKKGGLDFSRINKIVLSSDLLFGRQLIIKAKRK
jgi:SAM-dependent methyltransferase